MKDFYITFERAKKLLKKNLFTLEPVKKPVKHSLSYVLAEDIYSPIDLPPFTNSKMDGYAVRFKTSGGNESFILRKEKIKAGDASGVSLSPGESLRVFTGSPIPKMTDAVVPQEFTEVKGNTLYVKKWFSKGDNIRFKGEEIKKGKRVLKKNSCLSPAGIGFLSAMGIKEISVVRKPKIYVIVTGNEIIEPGSKLKEGKIYDANLYSLYSSLLQAKVEEVKSKRVKDDPGKIKKEFYKALGLSDIILFSGGISMGDYDFVRDLMKEERIETIFYKVRQKPGKPLYFGRKNEKLVFALPGNPASGLVCFYEYVYPSIRALSGFKDIFLPQREFPLLKNIINRGERLWFLKGKIKTEGVLPLDFQESHMLSSFAEADCLILAPGKKQFLKGDKVKTHLLPLL